MSLYSTVPSLVIEAWDGSLGRCIFGVDGASLKVELTEVRGESDPRSPSSWFYAAEEKG